jgi:hypothetical protein
MSAIAPAGRKVLTGLAMLPILAATVLLALVLIGSELIAI